MDCVETAAIVPDTSDIELIEMDRNSIETMEDLAVQVESFGLSVEVAFEADRIAPDVKLLEAYYLNNYPKDRARVAAEGIGQSIVDVSLRIMARIREMVKKAIQWLLGVFNSKSGFTGKSEQVVAVQRILNDPALAKAIKDGLAEGKGSALGVEDYFPNNDTATLNGMYSTYEASLSDVEIDFLTSGTKYKQVRNMVSDFTGGHLAEFIRDYEKDLFKWGQEGLEKAIHTGNGEDAVQGYIVDQTRKLKAMQEQYERPVRIINEMSDAYVKNAESVHRDRLKVFLREPSKLFPHLEHLWKEIHFERISEDDRKILHTLEDVERNHEQIITKFKTYANSSKKWAPEEEMFKLITKTHQEGMVIIGKLVRVAGYIKTASGTAYTASIKSLGYIIKVLNEISKLPNANREKVMKSIDIISAKRIQLVDVAKLAT